MSKPTLPALIIICAGLYAGTLIDCKNPEIQTTTMPETKPITTAKDSTKKDILNPETKFPNVLEDCYKLHYDAFVVDAHNDFLTQIFEKGADLVARNDFTQSGIPRFLDGGVDLQVFSVFVPRGKWKNSYHYAMEQINKLRQVASDNPDKLELAYNYSDISRITSAGKFVAMMGIEGGTPVENNLDNINEFFSLGVRYIGLTWNNSNNIGTSARDETEKDVKGGLTSFGREVIKRMDSVGMLIDVSHLGEKSFWDVIEESKNPIIASHSCCYSLHQHYRNLTDNQLKAIAKSGGVIMVNFYDEFLQDDAKQMRTKDFYQRYSGALDEIRERNGSDLVKFNIERDEFMTANNFRGGTRIDKLIQHIDYIKNLAGVDFIGLGSDYDGGIDPPVELYDATCYPMITKKLAEKGYTEKEIRKILGLNFLRVFKQVCG